jgi:hypothetical protein
MGSSAPCNEGVERLDRDAYDQCYIANPPLEASTRCCASVNRGMKIPSNVLDAADGQQITRCFRVFLNLASTIQRPPASACPSRGRLQSRIHRVSSSFIVCSNAYRYNQRSQSLSSAARSALRRRSSGVQALGPTVMGRHPKRAAHRRRTGLLRSRCRSRRVSRTVSPYAE